MKGILMQKSHSYSEKEEQTVKQMLPGPIGYTDWKTNQSIGTDLKGRWKIS